MCRPGWRRARVQAQYLAELARLRRVRDRIDREYARPLDVVALARDAGVPAGHLGRLFRAAYGRSPHGYLLTRRIERATALLRRGDLGVAEVALAVGCTSLPAFTARFTGLVGCPPHSSGSTRRTRRRAGRRARRRTRGTRRAVGRRPWRGGRRYRSGIEKPRGPPGP
ncbi:helix-turn-helix transcriptional regulator [Streptomyces fradiae]|uniref:helix-turn-helix transcriptional regulator n=1 Tax=Streptomyces fradiae TaxID=1906 RepID=UPI0036B009DF